MFPTIFSLLLIGCTDAPLHYPRTPSKALAEPRQTAMWQAHSEHFKNHPGHSGYMLLPYGRNALAARSMLINSARQTLDVQYFIFESDIAGQFLVEQLLAAADRGVRVRLLVDDWNQTAADRFLAAIDAHPKIEVRVFNPVGGHRAWSLNRPIQYVLGPDRIKRRMHNKALIADNVAVIVGGRNIADEYFSTAREFNFRDLDLLGVGPISREMSEMFDQFWNYELAIPATAWAPKVARDGELVWLRKALATGSAEREASESVKRARQSEWPKLFDAGQLPLIWADGEVVYDRPRKALVSIEKDPVAYMVPRLKEILEQASTEILMISPYFVPREKGVEWFRRVREHQIPVKVMTNSLAATDDAVSHGRYQHYRVSLLEMGVEIYELRPDPARRPSTRPADAAGQTGGSTAIFGGSSAGAGSGPPGGSGLGSSRRGLHAKALILDRQTMFVGSFNLDPRSARLDTQNGIVVWSKELSADLCRMFDPEALDRTTFKVVMPVRDAQNPWPPGNPRLIWLGKKNGQPEQFDAEPMTDLWRRTLSSILSAIAPEEWL